MRILPKFWLFPNYKRSLLLIISAVFDFFPNSRKLIQLSNGSVFLAHFNFLGSRLKEITCSAFYWFVSYNPAMTCPQGRLFYSIMCRSISSSKRQPLIRIRSFKYTLAVAEYSYFSADFRLKISLWIFFDYSVLLVCFPLCLVSGWC